MFILRCKKWNIFSIILYTFICVTLYSAEYIPRFSKRKVFFFLLFFFTRERSREQNEGGFFYATIHRRT